MEIPRPSGENVVKTIVPSAVPREKEKFLGFVNPSHLPYKTGDKVAIPAGVTLYRQDPLNGGSSAKRSIKNPTRVVVTVCGILEGKSYKLYSASGGFQNIHERNTLLRFKTSIGILSVDINDVEY
jgi:hypothetical protein